MKTIDKLNDIFRQVFDDDTINITLEMTADDIDGWDSLSHVNLIIAVETLFKIRFTKKELLTFRNIGDLMTSIDTKIKA